MPGTADKMVTWDKSGKKLVRKYYLTMNLKEAYAMHSSMQSEEERCKKSKLYSLRPKNVLLLGDTPKDQCKCQAHENLPMKLEAMEKQYESSSLDEIICDTSENSACWLNKSKACCNAKKFVPMLQLAAATNYEQWGNIHVKKQEKKQ